MTVDLAILRQDGVPLFNDDFNAMFREVFVRRFIPCLNEKFNQRDPSKPLTKLPEDVGDGVRLLVLCERLKAALKQDVKDHLDRQLSRSERSSRPAEAAPFKIVQASLELDSTVPPRGSLQERVVNHAIEMMASQLPESLDALQELCQMACDLGRGEMCMKLFRATAEKALAMAGKVAPKGPKPPARQISGGLDDAANPEDSVLSGLNDLKIDNSQEMRKLEVERARLEKLARDLEREKRELREEAARMEYSRANQAAATTPYASRRGQEMTMEPMDNEYSEENSFNNGQQDQGRLAGIAQDGALALRQGVVLEKVGRNTGDRIVRISGDTLEWRRGNGRFTKEHQVLRNDVVSIKVVDATGRTFLLSTKTGLLTLRALSEPAANLFVQALEAWARGNGSRLKRAPMTPSIAAPMAGPAMMNTAAPSMIAPATNTITSRRFPRISMSFKRPGTKTDNQLAIHRGADISFTSNGDGSFLREDD